MLRFAILLFVAVPLLGQSQAPCLTRPAAERAYDRDRLLKMVSANPPLRAEYLIKTCGVSVPFTAQLERELAGVGASQRVIDAVRQVAPRAPAPKPAPPPGPQIRDCAADSPEIGEPGERVSLSFSVANANAVTMNGLPVTNPVTVRPIRTMTYKLVAEGADGRTASCDIAVRLRPKPVPPVITNCAATPAETPKPGAPAEIGYVVSGAASVLLNGAPVNNPTTVTPQQTTTYTLTARSGAGLTATCQVTVRVAQDTEPKPLDVITNRKDGLEYVYIPAGTFRMGCAAKEDEPCLADEKPAHEVRISRGFWMGRTEVTVRAYKTYAAATNARMPANLRFGLDEQPMTEIDWNEAVGYCRWAGDLRLPTEAQWEYAASGVGHTGNQPPGASRLIAPSRMRKNSSPG